jgi:transcriptional regulator with XRE-family HTH domain
MTSHHEGHAMEHVAIGARLRAVRLGFSELNQKEWAGRHGFSETQYNNWETGTRRIPVECAEKLCNTYGLTLDFIYRGRRDGLSETARNVV